MIKLLTILLSFISFSSYAQTIGNQLKVKVIVTQYGHTKWALVYKPKDFDSLPLKKYPVIVYNHGVGETGSTENDLNKLLWNGVPNVIATTGNMKFGDKEFIVLSIQDRYWSPIAEESYYAIKNDPLIKNRIDTNGIFYTGLSAGGAETINAICSDRKITAIVPMSAAGAVTWANMNKKVKVWAFHGLGDQVCTYLTTERLIDSLGGKWTPLPTNHGPWPYYGKDYKEMINGVLMNIYEFMLSTMAPPPPVVVPKVIIEIFDNGTWKTKN